MDKDVAKQAAKQAAKNAMKQMGKKIFRLFVTKVLPPISPFLLKAALFFFIIIVAMVPIAMAAESIGGVVDGIGTFFGRLGGWLTGKGWNTSEEAYFKLFENEDCEYSKFVTSTLTYYYETGGEMLSTCDSGEEDCAKEYEERVEAAENDDDDSTTGDLPYGDMYYDGKTLLKKIKEGEDVYEEYVLDTFLESSPYNEMIENLSGDAREVQKKKIYKEMMVNAESVVCGTSGGGSGLAVITGQIRLPVDESEYIITSEFGPRTLRGQPDNHTGIDLGVKTGSPIYAIAPGKVVHAQKLTDSYGYHIIIAHDVDDDGKYDYFTLYAHNSELLVGVNDTVAGGQQIAKGGSTGNSTGSHLHFEIRVGTNSSSAAVDPKPYLEDIRKGTSVFNQMIKSEKKYYYQYDFSAVPYCSGQKSNGKDATIATSGCLPTSFSMVVAALKDSSVTPTMVAQNICDNYRSYRVEGSGTNSAIFTDEKFLSNYALKSTAYTSDYENNIKTALNDGKVIIVNVRNGIFNPSGSGHYIMLHGITSDGKVSVYDPGNSSNNADFAISDVTANITNGIWVFE